MTAIVLPDIDRSTLAELRERMPSLKLSAIDLPTLKLSDIDLPSLEDAGREADRTIDRILGRSRPTIWPWVAAAAAIAAIVGTAFALVTWYRRPGWEPMAGASIGSATLDEGGPVPGGYQGIGEAGRTVEAVTTEIDAIESADLDEGGRA